MDNHQLTPTDHQLLAREVMADSSGYVETCKSAFRAGWDAAMEHVAKIAAEGVEHLDGNCCHFQDWGLWTRLIAPAIAS